jgi:hypothetical protein
MTETPIEKPSQIIFDKPSDMDFLYARSVKDRIWVFLYESLNRDIQEGEKYISIYNEVKFYEICKGDLIKSKKDKYKPIKAALKKLIEEGDVIKVNIKGEPWKSREEEPWYHFRTDIKGLRLPDEYIAEEQRKLSEEEKLFVKLYNLAFKPKQDFTTSDLHSFKEDIQGLHHDNEGQSDASFLHFLDFIWASWELISIFRRPDAKVSLEERFDKGMFRPHLTLEYFPGPNWFEDYWNEHKEENVAFYYKLNEELENIRDRENDSNKSITGFNSDSSP